MCAHMDFGTKQVNFIGELDVLSKLEVRKLFILILRSEVPVFHRPLSKYLKISHRWALRQQAVTEGLPVLTQSGDGKSPDMLEVLSTALHCLAWIPIAVW